MYLFQLPVGEFVVEEYEMDDQWIYKIPLNKMYQIHFQKDPENANAPPRTGLSKMTDHPYKYKEDGYYRIHSGAVFGCIELSEKSPLIKAAKECGAKIKVVKANSPVGNIIKGNFGNKK